MPPRKPESPAQVSDGSLARLLLTIKSFLLAKANSESLLDDAAELSAAWTTAQRLHGAAGGLPGNPALAALPDPATMLSRYGSAVACAEADRIARLIEDPIVLAGPDPLPIPSRRAFSGRNDDGARARVLRTLRGPAVPSIVLDCAQSIGPARFTSPLAAARAVVLALDWVQAVEDTGEIPPDRLDVVHRIRQRLYDIRFACEVLLAARDRLLLHNADEDVTAWVTNANTWLAGLVNSRFSRKDKRWPDVLADVADRAVRGEPSDPLSPSTWNIAIWKRVARLCCALRRSMPGRTDVAGFKALHQASSSMPRMVDALVRAELILGPLRPDPLSEPTRIQMYAISAGIRSPLERAILPGMKVPAKERVDRKLSGNQLMNFASFLSARWRLNDWTWGRLDAASALVDVVARSERLRDPDEDTLNWLKKLQDQLRGDPALRRVPAARYRFELNSGKNIRELLTTWLHWSILRTELPLLWELGQSDQPPPPELLRNPPKPVESLEHPTELFNGAGSESVRQLLRKNPLRRAALRLGLVAWRALLPVPTKGKPAIGVRLGRGVLGVLKPLIVPPLVIGFLSPGFGLLSAFFGWIAVSAATRDVSGTPGHLLVACGAAVAGGFFVWHHVRAKLLPAFAGALDVFVLCQFGALAWVVTRVHGWLDPLLGEVFAGSGWRIVLAGVFGAVAAWYSLSGVVRAMKLRLIATSLTAFVVWTFTAILVRWGNWEVLDGWAVAAVVYVAIAAETVALTYFYPPTPKSDPIRATTAPPAETGREGEAGAPSDRREVRCGHPSGHRGATGSTRT